MAHARQIRLSQPRALRLRKIKGRAAYWLYDGEQRLGTIFVLPNSYVVYSKDDRMNEFNLLPDAIKFIEEDN